MRIKVDKVLCDVCGNENPHPTSGCGLFHGVTTHSVLGLEIDVHDGGCGLHCQARLRRQLAEALDLAIIEGRNVHK